MSVSTASAPPASAPAAGPRRARLYLTKLDPWSVMKTAFVLSIGMAIVIVVATMLLWLILSMAGTFDTINQQISDLGGSGVTGLDIGSFFSFGRIMGLAFLLAAFEIVLASALTTAMATIYNITVGFTGGVEVTLAEDH